MIRNPLKSHVLAFLNRQTTPVKEYDIIKELGDMIDDTVDSSNYEQDLFRKNFLVMNALYQLQIELLDDGVYLVIEPLRIELVLMGLKSNEKELSESIDAKMQEYYLNWDHFYETTREDVDALLNSFWDKFNSLELHDEALVILGLPSDSDWARIRNRYRTLAAKLHPDKGGNAAEFIEVRRAFEILRGIYA